MAKKILLVDDEPDISKLTSLRLTKMGYQVDIAYNGQEALDKLNKSSYDLIMLDYLMPVMDGKECAKKIKENEKTKNIPIIMFSASTTKDAETLVKELHVQDYLTKPFNPEDMMSKIKKFIGEP